MACGDRSHRDQKFRIGTFNSSAAILYELVDSTTAVPADLSSSLALSSNCNSDDTWLLTIGIVILKNESRYTTCRVNAYMWVYRNL